MSRRAIYLTLYNAASAVLKDNPCELQRNANGEVTCLAGTPCCGGCQHLGPDGCKVKALTCRTWTCYILDHDKPAISEALSLIKVAARQAGIPYRFRGSMEDHLDG